VLFLSPSKHVNGQDLKSDNGRVLLLWIFLLLFYFIYILFLLFLQFDLYNPSNRVSLKIQELIK